MWWLAWAASAVAGGAPRNVVVLYNPADPGSEQVADAYLDARVGATKCAVGGDPLVLDVTFADFDAQIRAPLDACLAALPDPDAIDYLVTVRGLPMRVALPAYTASLEAVLAVGHATLSAGGEVAAAPQELAGYYQASIENPGYIEGFPQGYDFTLSNPYQYWYGGATATVRADKQPRGFRRFDDWSTFQADFTGQLFIVGRLDGFDYADALALIDRAVAAEAAPPTGTFVCMHGADDARGARDPECEFTVRMLQALGRDAEWVPAFDGALAGRELAGWITGADDARGAIDGNTWAPGALADNLTSYGAVPNNFVCSADGLTCPASESQTSIARLVRAGATGAHGTVDEPLNNVFPNASALLYYAMGYSAGESWFFATRYLHWENLVLGDPLAAPYAVRPLVDVPSASPAGAELVVTASHPDGVAHVALYEAGVLVAEADGDTARWVPPGDVGDTVQLYVEATAENADLATPGWPIASTLPRPDVVGWTTAAVTLTAASTTGPGTDPSGTDTQATDGVGDEPDSGGCGCAAAAGSGGSAWALAALLVARRRKAIQTAA